MPTDLVRAFPGVQAEWSYVSTRPRWNIVLSRWRARVSRRPGPVWDVVVPPEPSPRWLVYFIFTADGKLSESHHFTLQRLSEEGVPLLVICACPPKHAVLDELKSRSAALYWKALEGWDFSAYAIALSELARLSPGADVLVMNDSVLGPFRPLVPFMEAAPWRLTGFTGNAREENHVQSYAFVVRSIDPQVMEALRPVMSTEWSYNAAEPVILLQETRLACTANRFMTVGAYFFTDGSHYDDLCLNCPEELLTAGFPFLKRSLFGKFAGVFQDPLAMQSLLRGLNHPDARVA